jgi:hypothetical protein
MHPQDPWRAANYLINDLGGAEAERLALHRLEEMLEAGNLEQASVWRLIVGAVAELRRTALREGEGRH